MAARLLPNWEQPEWRAELRLAALLREAGVMAVPVVAGKVILPEAVERAPELRVWHLTDGQVVVSEP